MKNMPLIILMLIGSYNLSAQQGSSCSDPFYIYPALDCNNTVDLGNGLTGWLGGKQCPKGHCGNYTMAGTTDVDGSCPGDDKLQTAVSWLAVTATTDSFTINNNRDNNTGGAAGNALDYVVFSGTCGNLTEITCQVVNGLGGTYTVTGLTSGNIYYVLVSRTGTSTSTTGNVCITSTVPYVAPGNECTSAVPLNTEVTYSLNNAGASPTGPMCAGIVSTENVAWYQWCAPADWPSGQSAFINLNNQKCNGSSGLQLTVWNTGTTCPTANTDPTVICKNSDQNQQDYYFEWIAVANTCYYIAVDGYGGTACNYDLTVGSIIVACDTPDFPVTSGKTICKGDSSLLIASGSTGNFKWYDAPVGGNLLLIGDTLITTTLNTTTTYYVSAFISNCEGNRTAVTIEVLDYPLSEAGISDTITCSKTTLTLDGSGSSSGAGISYAWTSSAGGNIQSGANTINPIVSTEGTYFLTVSNSNNGKSCISTDSVLVAADTIKPVASIADSDKLTCLINTLELDATSSSFGLEFTFLWNTNDGIIANGDTGVTPEINGPGTYNISVTDTTNGCSAQASITVLPPPDTLQAMIASPDKITCINNEITLDAAGTSSSSFITYSWGTADGNIVSGANTLLPVVDMAGIYTLNVIDNNSSCTSTASISVGLDTTSPVVNIQYPDTLTCIVTQLSLSSTITNGQSFNWATTDGNIISGSNTSSPLIDAPGLYSLTVTGGNGCVDTASVLVIQNTIAPIVSIGNDTTLCFGENFTPNVSVEGGTAFSWFPSDGVSDPGKETPVLSPQSSVTYSLEVTNPVNGCKSSDIIDVNVNEVTASISASEIKGTAPFTVNFNGNTSGGVIYSWSQESESFATTLNASYEFLNGGSFNVVFTTSDTNGCSASASMTIEVEVASFLNIPNVFTPNGDGKNEIFSIEAGNIEEFDIFIFNRWGEELFYSPMVSISWDGYSKSGNPVPEGTYFYMVNASGNDNKSYSINGTFSLIR